MDRYLRVYRTFLRSSLSRELEFRANFFAKVLQNLAWMTFFLLILFIIFSRTKSVAGWNRADSIVLAGTVFLQSSLSSMFFSSLLEIPEHVRKGTLDFVVTKPIDSQFWISARRFEFGQIGTFFAGIVLVIIGLHQGNVTPSLLQVGAFASLTLVSVALFYSLNLSLMTLGIWWVRVDNLWVLGETIREVVRYPIDIFPSGAARFLTVYVPFAFLGTIPTKMIVRGIEPGLYFMGLGWAVVAVFAARKFWNFALKHYSSASS
jgi:ABC-2 type transport system permease protein